MQWCVTASFSFEPALFDRVMVTIQQLLNPYKQNVTQLQYHCLQALADLRSSHVK